MSEGAKPKIKDSRGLYHIDNADAFWRGNGDGLSKLANFSAWIDEELILDDGAEATRLFVISGKQHGRELPQVRIPAKSFASMNWAAEYYGAQAVIAAGTA